MSNPAGLTQFQLIQMRLPDIITPEISNIACKVMLGDDIKTALDRGLYKATASIDARDLENLYLNSQKDVFPGTDLPRSMSVGDMAVNVDTNEVYLCAPVGWKSVECSVKFKALALCSSATTNRNAHLA